MVFPLKTARVTEEASRSLASGNAGMALQIR
jgi:hypothetical protein